MRLFFIGPGTEVGPGSEKKLPEEFRPSHYLVW